MRRKKPEGEDGYSYICAICEDFGELLCCERCRQCFHLACIGMSSCPEDSWLCDDCSQNKVRCFDCKEYGRFKENVHRCGVGLCGKIYHDHCIKEWDRPQPKGRSGIICPHHYCDVCWNGQSARPGKDNLYRCLKCPTAYHEVCFPDGAGLLEDIPGFMLCAKHNEAWKCQNDGNAPTEDVKVAFNRLPLPSVPQDFKLPVSLKVAVRRFLNRPPPYVHIRRNIYLVNRPRKKAEENTSCLCHASGDSTVACNKDCLCGILLTSCSSSCKCGDACTNLSFQKRPGRKLKAAKTDHCGWGLQAGEDIKAGDFLVEYVGEVIDDETCEKRLWAMKEQGESNFYMCEISREIVIDATFKGNLSRFINHSCSPNSELQKWEIEGEVRIGVFAKQDFKKGEYVSYDYQFIQFGTDQLCHCGAPGCRGQLGKPHKQISSKSMRREALLPRPSRRSKLYGRFSIERGFTPINGVFRHPKNSFGEALKVVQADVQYQRKGRDNNVGLRVRVWWPLDQKFYHGKIVRYDPTIGKHQIMYDDGQAEDLHMAKERWEVEERKPSRPKRSRSPVQDENNDKSDVGRPRRGPSPLSDEKNTKTQVSRLRRGSLSASDAQSGEPMVSGPNRGQAHVLQHKRDHSSPALESNGTQPSIFERKTRDLLPMECRRTRSRILRRRRDQPSVSKEGGSKSPAVPDDRSDALTVCKDYTRKQCEQALESTLDDD
ncbi:unnamed protein product [Calypogeia fissa]